MCPAPGAHVPGGRGGEAIGRGLQTGARGRAWPRRAMQPTSRGMPCPSFARQSAALCKQSNDTGSRPEIGWPPAPVWQASRMACAARIQNIENNPMQSSLAQHFRGPTPIEAGATGLPLPLAGEGRGGGSPHPPSPEVSDFAAASAGAAADPSRVPEWRPHPNPPPQAGEGARGPRAWLDTTGLTRSWRSLASTIPRKHFDSSGKSPAIFHHCAIRKTHTNLASASGCRASSRGGVR